MIPTVSIILPAFNAAATLDRAIASVKAQSRCDWELLVIDDGSADNSVALIDQHAAADPRVRRFGTNGQMGAGVARNTGLAAALGAYVAFIDADDQWHKDKLSIQLDAMAQSGAVFSCTAYLRHNLADGRETVIGVPPKASRAQLLKTNTIACSTVIYDRRHFGARRMPTLRRRQDFAFWLQLLQDTPYVLGIPEVLMTYSQHHDSLSGNKRRAALDTWKMYRSLGLSAPGAAYYFGHYALRGIIRYRWPQFAKRLGLMAEARPAP